MNNIELISDRGLSINLKELAEVKKRYPDNAVIASIMAGNKAEWLELIRRIEDTGADGFELNFSCPTACVNVDLARPSGRNLR